MPIGAGSFLNLATMIAAIDAVGAVGDHAMFANGCFVGDGDHRSTTRDVPVTWQGFSGKGPVTRSARSLVRASTAWSRAA